MWNEIVNEVELKSFMEVFGNFHDSCIKEFKYISGAFVNEDLSMYPINSRRNLKIIFQRQVHNPAVIEMEFIGVLQLKIFPVEDNYTCEIDEATMGICDNYIFWCDEGGVAEIDVSNYKGSLICSSMVKWRIADEYIGNKEIY